MVKQCDLEAPAAHSNTFSDYKEMDYSDKIGTGTIYKFALGLLRLQ